ncbi:TetR/AcrR family transcriptional regulator [Marinitenerispora sediminis]|uniref:TetR/AcrR family transcriptional regulator n=1 Tax=Marinitenerispora sediminis TaxID=1931232 RepID=A0A368T1V4_9ACTN|nr:TetR/AcrR family transcriptional regulator [Marinitenerispora sediminis]RCV47437.1 TetR/AcrR family transcriptional regulator [Marinitenerispora sediminis]RCV47540.1 TetR/AcrR family transcriptional regulator [Marinitenerispora sediminis]RCV54341.1 TetR/AcrR family transcriptional regulator [Marinitenerispora sediminis]
MTNQRKPRGPYRKSAQRREQILQAAYEAVDEYGERASLHDIAARVGVTQPALTYYFPTRDELLIAVLERWDVQGRALAGASGEDQSMIDGMVAGTRHTTDHPGLAKLFVTLSAAATDPESPAHGFFAERYRTLAAEVTRDVEEKQRAGAIRADEPAEHLARAVIAVLNGLQLQWMHDPAVDMAAIAETFTRMLAPPGGTGGAQEPEQPPIGP